MFKILLFIGTGLFAFVVWFVFQLSFWNIFFLVLMFIFYFTAGYYHGWAQLKIFEKAYLSRDDVDAMFGNDKKL